MNANWQDFLKTQQVVFLDNDSIQFNETSDNLKTALYPIPQLSVLKVIGEEAAGFLQGQLTCNIKELNDENSFFAAFCNAKGRALTTLLIFKKQHEFILILPTVLLEKIQKKLQIYILRSKVILHDASAELCISGLCCSAQQADETALPLTNFARKNEIIKLADSRYLIVADPENSIKYWSFWLEKNIKPQNSKLWDYLDIYSGMAWLDNNSSEEYIPQMLNIDKLGGISFNKGCYTGQEVIARTHYLGKAKRSLFVAQCAADVKVESHNIVDENEEIVGKVIKSETFADTQILLIVMQTSATELSRLKLDNANQDKIVLLVK